MDTMSAFATGYVPRTGHPGDDAQLEAISLRGERFTRLRWQHHLYLPDEESAVQAGRSAAAAGWETSRSEALPAPYSGWMLRLYRHDVLTGELVSSVRDHLDALARSHRGRYDGWDALDAATDPAHWSTSRRPPSRVRRVFHRHAPAGV